MRLRRRDSGFRRNGRGGGAEKEGGSKNIPRQISPVEFALRINSCFRAYFPIKNPFHSGESRNLILASARIFREAEQCNARLRRMRLRRRDSGFCRNGRGGRAEKERGSKNILRQISPMGICFANQLLFPRSLPIFQLPLPLRCGIPIVVKFHMHQKMAAIFFREPRHRAVFVRLHALRQIASRTDIHHPARLIRHHIHRRLLFCHARDYRMKKQIAAFSLMKCKPPDL